MFYYNRIEASDDVLFAICDADLMGKTLGEEDFTLTIDKAFYGSTTCTEKDIPALLEKVTIVNALGKNIISFLEKNNYIDSNGVRKIHGIPHAQIVTVR